MNLATDEQMAAFAEKLREQTLARLRKSFDDAEAVVSAFSKTLSEATAARDKARFDWRIASESAGARSAVREHAYMQYRYAGCDPETAESRAYWTEMRLGLADYAALCNATR